MPEPIDQQRRTEVREWVPFRYDDPDMSPSEYYKQFAEDGAGCIEHCIAWLRTTKPPGIWGFQRIGTSMAEADVSWLLWRSWRAVHCKGKR